jgi:hypothetical protein
MLELNVTHANAPHTRTHYHLRALLTRHLRGLFHRFDAKRGAATLQGSVRYDVTDATTEVEQERAQTCAGKG